MVRAWSKSPRVPRLWRESAASCEGFRFACQRSSQLVQAAGMSDWLPSGNMTSK
jgi:hypothetical protein